MGCTITAEDNGFEKTADYEQIKESTYIATCIQVIDLGTQKNYFFGKDKPDAKKKAAEYKKEIMFVFELDELMQDGRPFFITATYEKVFYKTDKSNAKNSLQYLLEKWRGKECTPDELKRFNLSNVLGVPCNMTVKLKDKPDTKGRYWPLIEAVSSLRKPKEAVPPINELVDFGINDIDDAELFAKVHPLGQYKIKESKEGKAYFLGIHDVDPEEPGEAF